MILSDSFKESGAFFDKVRSPAETIEWVRKRMADIELDILQETVRIDQGRLGIPVYISKYHPSVASLTGSYKQMGKGATPEQAEASAIMELVERFSLFDFFRNRNRPFHLMDLDSPDFMPVGDMLKSLHASIDDPAAEENLQKILEILPLEWVEAVVPSDGRSCKAPFSWFWPINEYNGSASGNSFEEAAVQAVSEVVERHVCSVITYDRLVTPEIDQNSVVNEVALDLLSRFSENGINLVLKDFSLGTGVPTVGALAWDPATYPDRSEIVYTAGTAPDPERALIRALTEVAQLAGDFDTQGKYVESGLPKFDNLRDAAYIMDCSRQVSVKEMPCCGSDNFRSELETMCRNLEEGGLKVYIADITHPDLAVPAVYAMVAGNHFRDRTLNLDLPFHSARIASVSPDRGAALETLNFLDRKYPERYDVAFFKGRLHEEKEAYDAAVGFYRKALANRPDEGEVASIHCHLGICMRELGRLEDAVSALKKAKDLNPSLKEIHNQLGYCYYRQGEYLQAIDAFEEAVALDPGSAIDYANIASNLRKLGMYSDAMQFYDIALELDPAIEWAQLHRNEVMELINA